MFTETAGHDVRPKPSDLGHNILLFYPTLAGIHCTGYSVLLECSTTYAYFRAYLHNGVNNSLQINERCHVPDHILVIMLPRQSC